MIDKLAKNIVLVVSTIILTIFVAINILYVTIVKNQAENVFMNLSTSLELIMYFAIDIALVILFKFVQENKKMNKYIKLAALILGIVVYALISIKWVNSSTIEPIDDSKSVNDLAICFAEGNMDEIKNSGYIEKYPNQIGMTFIIGMIYKIFRTTNYRIIQCINIAANIITFAFLYLILKKLEKKYVACKIAYWVMALTFIPLILLTTYVYGDYIGLAFSAVGLYFVIDYKEKEQIIKLIISAICMCLAYFTKMNYIIVTLAILIYLGLYFIKDIQEKNKTKIIKSAFTIIIYFLIAVIPFSLLKNYCMKKFEYKSDMSIPTSVWIYIGMTESSRANGWYGVSANESWDDTPLAHKTYPQKVKYRIKELITHPIYTLKFYLKKTISGWVDPYFQSLWYNVGWENKDEIMNNIINSKEYKTGEIYQKAIMVLMYIGALVAVIKNRKNLSNELVLLITVFIGGVLFHTMWEMKSRYTLPYVILLIPVSSIGIQDIVSKVCYIGGKKNEKNISSNTNVL